MNIVGKIRHNKETKFNLPDMATLQDDKITTLYERVNNIDNNVHDIKTLLFGVMVLLSVIFVIVILILISK